MQIENRKISVGNKDVHVSPSINIYVQMYTNYMTHEIKIAFNYVKK